jgi:hypothetical protein
VTAGSLVPLSFVSEHLELLAGQAGELAAELGVPVVAGWRGVPSVSERDADAMAAEMTARREKAAAQVAEAVAAARPEPASGPWVITDRPGQPALQHQPWAGRLT